MSNANELFPIIRDKIEFEHLLGQATEALTAYSGKCWTDMAEHDPGITLTQALGYGVADLAYRQTRPLSDLLTPPPELQTEGGLFPAEFAPHQALTCSPINETDYRRALLDLHSTGNDDGYFFFCNAQLIREPEAERYQYWYNPAFREYSFKQPPAADGPISIELLGNYYLYLVPSRETLREPQIAQIALDEFLLNNRNLGEAVSKVIWLQPEALNVELVIELEDDIGSNSNIAAILADIYQAAEHYVTPAVVRSSTTQLQAEGMSSEDIHQGPWLRHGWIPQLPPQTDGTTAATVNLSGLVSTLLEVDGVKGIRHLDATPDNPSSSRWQWVARAPGVFPLLWGDNPLAVLAQGNIVKLLASGDVPLTATQAEITAELDKSALLHNVPQRLPYGRWREPERYYPATDIVPPCYNLQLPTTSSGQTLLHQFLLTFEQLLANGCQQQALLPALLAFKRGGDVVWGQQWPFMAGTVSDKVHRDYRFSLDACLAQSSHDREQELAITGFLLGYFNSQLAPDIFTQPADTFLASQQGFLSRHTELAYHRSNVRAGQVSALQRRIAARLGLGGADIFGDNPPLDKLPFYLVEHRALLPVQSSARYDVPQTPVAASEERAAQGHFLVLASADVSALKAGQLIDILLDYGSANALHIRGQMVKGVDALLGHFWLDIEASAQLGHRLDDILASSPAALAWQNSPVWLEDMNFPLEYASDQSGLAGDQRRLTCSPFPVMATAGDKLVLEFQITPDIQEYSTQSFTVISVDRIANTLVVSSTQPFPDEHHHYQWYFATADYASRDRFSFMTSAVFNQHLLQELTSDPYATEAWVREIILEEIPSHTGMLIHWKPGWEFDHFAATYCHWQNGGAGLGDKSYELMRILALGQLPGELLGIGSMYIATQAQQATVLDTINGDGWNEDIIVQDQLFYVPSLDNPI